MFSFTFAARPEGQPRLLEAIHP